MRDRELGAYGKLTDPAALQAHRVGSSVRSGSFALPQDQAPLPVPAPVANHQTKGHRPARRPPPVLRRR